MSYLFGRPKAALTEENLPDQSGKVFIVTGGNAGLGKTLSSILYQRNGTVYVAARSAAKAQAAIDEIKASHPDSTGRLKFLHLDLADLSTIKKSAGDFLQQESRLDVLWNNAGVMVPPPDSKTEQGYELQLGTNVIGPFLFTHLLTPLLVETVKRAPKLSVRVIWLGSSAINLAPKPAIDFENINYEKDEGQWIKYGRSKAANVILGAELARREGGKGLVSLSLDPGVYLTDLQRDMPRYQVMLIKTFGKDPKFGSYTELYAGLSKDITEKDNGGWILPYGRIAKGRGDLYDLDLGRKLWDWNEAQTRSYL